MTDTVAVPLTRAALADAAEPLPAAPARIVHIGLGAFHRAHQAWYTARATNAADWGIRAFTGRSGQLADLLSPQDGVFTLVERAATGDRLEHIGSIVAVHPAAHTAQLSSALASPRTALVTLTVTEAGYSLTPTGKPDLADPALLRDLHALTDAHPSGAPHSPETILGRLLTGLAERRRRDGGPLAVVPCDNFPSNGTILGRTVTQLAEDVSAGLGDWIRANVSFVSTSVDRITPRVDGTLAEQVRTATGWVDAAPVAAEPFTDWTLSGEFPAGRPDWESAGAVFVEDIEPYESRKLWLLNGSHSLLAYLGRLRGHTTVAQAIGDNECLRAVDQWWDEASRHLPSNVNPAAYRAALLERFRNPRIAHSLTQISADGLTKLSIRIVPVARMELREGRDAEAAAGVVAAWIAAVRTGLAVPDARAAEVDAAAVDANPTGALLSLVAPDLAVHPDFAPRVAYLTDRLTGGS